MLCGFYIKMALRKTEEVWFLNNEDARLFAGNRIVDIQKMKVLPGEGINTDHFAPVSRPEKMPDTPFNFLMSTRLLKSKGVAVYVNAARILKNKGYDTHFELIGFF